MKILVVDDDFFFQKAIGFNLSDQEHTLLFCNNGQKAVDLISIHTDIDLVICDIDMPVLMGHEFIIELKKTYKGKQPVVVIVSAINKNTAFLNVPGFEYDHYFEKPLDISLLDELLSKLK